MKGNYIYKLLGSRFESCNSIYSFALLYSIHFESKTTRKRKRKRKGNSISLVPTTAALPQISQKKVIRRRCSLVRRQHSVSFSEFHSVFQLILDMTCLALKMLSQHCHRLTCLDVHCKCFPHKKCRKSLCRKVFPVTCM